MPKGFVLAKPLQQGAFDESEIYKLEKEDNLIITRKRDGWKIFAVVFKRKVKLYTDGLRDVTETLQHIKKEIEAMQLPSKTILVGEAVFDDGTDHLGVVGSTLNSNPEKAIELQRTRGFLRLIIFDMVFDDGEQCVGIKSYEYRLDLIINMFMISENNPEYVQPIEIIPTSYDEAKKVAVAHKWEGLVCYARNFISSFRLDGKNPQRISGCYKWKPICEDDFIVRKWIPSENDPTSVKELLLLQIDPTTKKEFDCGKLGTFSNAMRKELALFIYPIVVQVKFEVRNASGKLRNKVFMGIRTDKKVRDCLAPKSFSEAT